jgi:D-tagatose-1,6-bisphosphate aldolase subunit GatZ/KbaZ
MESMNSTEVVGSSLQNGSSEQPDIAIVGELNPDLIVYGAPRELPEERELLASGFTLTLGSSSAIFAHNLSLLGSKVTFSSRVGGDALGQMCCRWLQDAGVQVDHVVQSASGSNTGITVILPFATTRRILTYPGAMFEMGIDDLDLDYLATAKHFHLSSLFLHRKLSADIPELFREMKRRGLTTSLDTNDDPEDKWAGVLDDVLPLVDVLLCTESELAKMAKAEPAAERMSAKVPLLVVKRGAAGASAYFEGRRIDVPSLRVEVKDSVGAGDTFDAGFLHKWVRKAPLETCIAYGNLAGGLSVTRSGGTEAFCDRAYRENFFQQHWQQEMLVPYDSGIRSVSRVATEPKPAAVPNDKLSSRVLPSTEDILQRSNMTSEFEGTAASRNSVDEMRQLLRENREGKRRGIYSVCTANRLVLEAAFAQAAHDGSLLLIEATCNQVNQQGGYTGMVPAQFRDYIHAIAEEMHFPIGRVVLGGDHLGPNPWKDEPASVAMEKACIMVAAYADAGFSKIHLDASMACADDATPLAPQEIAERAARLCEVAETATRNSAARPVYVIGTEVPTPGGAVEEMEIEVTSTESLRETLEVHRRAFERRNLLSAWDRIIGVVVQPGVEFGHDTVEDYQPDKALQLSEFILQQDGIVFEAHSTDYQTTESLRQLVSGHFGILKVGPELTFVMREAIFGLARIEEEWIAEERRSNLRAIIEQVMLEHPGNWKGYYHGDEHQQQIARAYSLSDRIRYYWPNGEISKALAVLLENLREHPAPLPLLSQYLPQQAEAIRTGTISTDPVSIIHDKVRESLARYTDACGLALRG